MKQLEHSFAMFRKTCMEKTGADASQVDGLHKGNFPENDKKLKVIHFYYAIYSGFLITVVVDFFW